MSADFLTDFCQWLATQASLAYGTQIVRYQFGQGKGVQTYITQTGGADRNISPVEPVTLQVMTKGAGPLAAMERARRIYNAIYPPPARLPVRMAVLSEDWRANSIDAIQGPYDLGVIENNERQVVFNLRVKAACTFPS
jgi:hypothetical protein